MSDRATLEEVQEFANAVRAAGGGNPLDALMPAVPQSPSECLIAKNLNFNCSVQPEYKYGNRWTMKVDDSEVASKIAKSLDLEILPAVLGSSVTDIALPERIWRVADMFDMVYEYMNTKLDYKNYLDDVKDNGAAIANEDLWADVTTSEELSWEEFVEAIIDTDERTRILMVTEDDVKEMLPYIEESTREAYDNATKITENGEIVI